MAKLIINIPDDEYNHFMHADNFNDGFDAIEYICNGTVLDNVTNGDVIKAMFPDALKSNYIESGLDMKDYVAIYIGDYEMRVAYDWWNAPYKAESEE